MSKADEAIIYCIDNNIIQFDLETGYIFRFNRRIAKKPQSNGYIIVTIPHPMANPVSTYVHRIIAYAGFGGTALLADTIYHIDRNRQNNSLSNLEPKSYLENSQNRKQRERLFSPSEIEVIRQDRINGFSYNDLCLKYSISTQTVLNILLGRAAYAEYDRVLGSAHGNFRQNDWTEFWIDVDAGKPHAYLVHKYDLTFSAVAHRIERRKI